MNNINEELLDELDDDIAMYQITPKDIAILSLLRCGLIDNMDDPKAEGFWILFENGMRTGGYIKEEE